MGSETFLDYTRFHVGAVLPRDMMVPRVQNFIGYMSQLNFNNEDYFDKMRAGLLSEQFFKIQTLDCRNKVSQI